ncbi:MAG: phosphomethylpyrimidine synthase ThiC [ANME-2 cluster archaeon]|nr:phosphomethylpyrimidine synthase ThiC [ANME-2 cluster archaeon]
MENGKTHVELAKCGIITPQMEAVASCEGIESEVVLSRVAEGSLVIMTRGQVSVAIGKGATTKVNVNIGTSSAKIDPEEEIEKARVAERYRADTLTDLSMGGDISSIRRSIYQHTTLPITTVPIYQSVAQQGIYSMTEDYLLNTIESQVDEGASSVVLHCIERDCIEKLKGNPRIMGMVSKGGSFTSIYMLTNECGNPFIDNFDSIMDILKKNDVVLSLGNTMRSGCIHDKPDSPQRQEILTNMKLAKRANAAGVQVIVEGMGGHVQASEVAGYVRFHKDAGDFPLFVAGPLPTDVAVGYDHIAGAVGASMAAGAGADYLCYITPSEHLRLPTVDDVREGLVAFRIAAHIGDSIKFGAGQQDRELAKSRAVMDWDGQMQHAIEPEKASRMCPKHGPCTMCGNFCALEIMHDFLNGDTGDNGDNGVAGTNSTADTNGTNNINDA